MSLLDRILDEGRHNNAAEKASQARGDSNAFLARMKKRTPRAKMSQAAGSWDYNPVAVGSQNAMFTKWTPPAKMVDMATGGQQIAVRQESVEDVTSRIDTIVDAIFAEDE